jgi:hypothetical protein
MKPGGAVEVEIEGIGILRNPVAGEQEITLSSRGAVAIQ